MLRICFLLLHTHAALPSCLWPGPCRSVCGSIDSSLGGYGSVGSSPRVRSRSRSRGTKASKAPTSAGTPLKSHVESPSSESSVVLLVDVATAAARSEIDRLVSTDSDPELQKHASFDPAHQFGFLDFSSTTEMNNFLIRLGASASNEGISVMRCASSTPGVDPRAPAPGKTQADAAEPTLVLKNLPFAMTQVQLSAALSAIPGAAIPVEVTCRYNAAGAFSGMAFVRYRSRAAAESALLSLGDVDVFGRKVRAEFKRVETQRQSTNSLPKSNSAAAAAAAAMVSSWRDHPSMSVGSAAVGLGANSVENGTQSIDLGPVEVCAVLEAFRDGPDEEYVFPATLSSSSRRRIHTSAIHYGLQHVSEGNGHGKYVRVYKTSLKRHDFGNRNRTQSENASTLTGWLGSTRPRTLSGSYRPPPHSQPEGGSSLHVGSIGALRQRSHSARGAGLAATQVNASGGARPRANSGNLTSAPESIIRQPKAPDGSGGFARRARSSPHPLNPSSKPFEPPNQLTRLRADSKSFEPSAASSVATVAAKDS